MLKWTSAFCFPLKNVSTKQLTVLQNLLVSDCLTPAWSCEVVSPTSPIICPSPHPVKHPYLFQVSLEVTYLHYSLPAPTATITAAAAVSPKAVWIRVDKPLLAGFQLVVLVWKEKRCLLVLLMCSQSLLFRSLQHLVWHNQSVPSPIHWTLSHSSINTLSLSLSSLSLHCILVSSPLNSLPLSPSLWTSTTPSHPPSLCCVARSPLKCKLCTVSVVFSPFNPLFPASPLSQHASHSLLSLLLAVSHPHSSVYVVHHSWPHSFCGM